MIATVDMKEVYAATVEVEVPDGAGRSAIVDAAKQKFEAEGASNTEYSHTLDDDTWTVRDDKGNYL